MFSDNGTHLVLISKYRVPSWDTGTHLVIYLEIQGHILGYRDTSCDISKKYRVTSWDTGTYLVMYPEIQGKVLG